MISLVDQIPDLLPCTSHSTFVSFIRIIMCPLILPGGVVVTVKKIINNKIFHKPVN